MKTATEVRRLTHGWTGDARVYRMDPQPRRGVYHVVASTAPDWRTGEEVTLVVWSESTGHVIDWEEELYEGPGTHADAFRSMGYETGVVQ